MDIRVNEGGAGLCGETLLATQDGWQKVASLKPGDLVMTFESGLQPLRAIRCVAARGALHVPAGALGNRQPLRLLPDQPVLIEARQAGRITGPDFVLVPARALEGHAGIAAMAGEGRGYALEFDLEEIVYAEGMALLHCRAPHGLCGGWSLNPLPAPATLAEMLGARSARLL